MYLNHFGLREMPFGLTPDTAFTFSTRAHQEALNTLLVAAKTGEGIIKITGEVGTGKTLLCRRFLRSLPEDYVSCYLPNPIVTPRTLVLSLADELGEPVSANAEPYTLHRAIGKRLLALAAEGKQVIFCLDEAQALTTASLEVLRLMTNIETEKRKLLQVILFGQPELDERLDAKNLRQLRQRIAFAYHLEEMTCYEVRSYLRHRLRVASGATSSAAEVNIFKVDAAYRIHQASKGTPRLVNILAHKALLAAFGEGGAHVEIHHVQAAIRDSRDNLSTTGGWLNWSWR